MAADVVMYGAITVPMSTREEWMTQLIQQREYEWLSEIGELECAHQTPENALEALKDFALEPHERLELNWMASTLAIEVAFSFERYLQLGQTVTELVASCSASNGFGALTILGHRPMRFGFRVSVSRGGVNFQKLSIDQRLAEEQTDTFAKTMVRTAAQLDRLVGRIGVEPRVNPFSGHAA